ncbi:MAG: class I SAM-dependent methyltransferase [Candidatus Izimaplasma sp.]|nr:class I SAM-dependent methyltransferase [Candidatus Izimaplasma bacterium]
MKKLNHYISTYQQPRILDLATGAGNFIKLLTDLTDDYREIIGIDKEKSAIDMARKHFSNERIVFKQMSANHLNFKLASFDIVCFSNSLHHVTDLSQIFKEIKTVLKPDGIVIVAEMVRDRLTDAQKSHLLLHHFAAKIDRLCGIIHDETYTRKEIKNLVTSHSDLTLLDHWMLRYNRKKSNTDEEIKWLLKTIDKLSQKIPKHAEEMDDLIDEGREIKTTIEKYGFASCPTKVMVLKR